ncbi:MAG: hypothetical protein ABMB14_38560, partial [Myxococcota bacterium]
HLALRLEGIRNIVASKLPIEFHATIAGDRWTGVARVPRSVFPDPPLTCNAYRIAGAAPARRYFAMVGVPGERPDFHRLDRFVPWPL